MHPNFGNGGFDFHQEGAAEFWGSNLTWLTQTVMAQSVFGVTFRLHCPEGAKKKRKWFDVEAKDITGLKLHITQFANDGRYTKHGHVSIQWDAMPKDQKEWDNLPDDLKKLLKKGHAGYGLWPVIEILLSTEKHAELMAKCGNDFYGPNGEIPRWRVCYYQLREKTPAAWPNWCYSTGIEFWETEFITVQLADGSYADTPHAFCPNICVLQHAMAMTLQSLKGKKQALYQTRYATELSAPLCRRANEQSKKKSPRHNSSSSTFSPTYKIRAKSCEEHSQCRSC